MTIKEKYNLQFSKIKALNDNNRIINQCTCNSGNKEYNGLTIVDMLNETEIIILRDKINKAINGDKMYEGDEWVSQSIEDGYNIIYFEYPNITLREMITIPMTEMLQLLDEWIEFCGYK